jgi:hypothetical protein
MNRVDKGCCGDCAQCALLADGKVDMVPCALDQILRRLMRLERLVENKKASLAAAESENE